MKEERGANLVVRLEDARCRHLLPDWVEVPVIRGRLERLRHLSSHPIGGRRQNVDPIWLHMYIHKLCVYSMTGNR